jgi:hypothetical protein
MCVCIKLCYFCLLEAKYSIILLSWYLCQSVYALNGFLAVIKASFSSWNLPGILKISEITITVLNNWSYYIYFVSIHFLLCIIYSHVLVPSFLCCSPNGAYSSGFKPITHQVIWRHVLSYWLLFLLIIGDSI